ncbi:hypothetical protein SUDANB176_02806 [Streptomyces sp. enrichment culture]
MSSALSRRTVLAATAGTAALTAPGSHAAPALPNGTSEDKVLLIGMDGLRQDRIDAANAPHLKTIVRLDSTTLYRQEGGQTARILASFNGGTPAVVGSYASDVIAQPQSLAVPVPSGASGVSFRFRYTGANTWYWVIDGVRIVTS